MISVSYSSIPNYLKDGSFYKSLNGDTKDGQTEIPEHCFAENDIVNNVDDL